MKGIGGALWKEYDSAEGHIIRSSKTYADATIIIQKNSASRIVNRKFVCKRHILMVSGMLGGRRVHHECPFADNVGVFDGPGLVFDDFIAAKHLLNMKDMLGIARISAELFASRGPVAEATVYRFA